MSDEEQPKQPTGPSYDATTLPPPVTVTDTYLRAVLVEQRVMRKAIADLTKAVETLTKATERNTQAEEQATRVTKAAGRK